MLEYQKHIKHPHAGKPKEAVCGEPLTSMDWAFEDIDHAFLSVRASRLQPCPKCAAAVIAVFTEAE